MNNSQIEVLDEKNLLCHFNFIFVTFGCSTINHHLNKTSQSVPEEMPASKYVGQGFQPKAEKALLNMRRNTEKNMKNSENNSLKITLV